MRCIGLDVGHKRIGVAIADPRLIIAQPLNTITADSTGYAQLRHYIATYAITQLVVGLPKNRYGLPTAQTAWIKDWVSRRQSGFVGLSWVYWDESYSTRAAEHVLLSANMRRNKRKQVRDQQAAVFMLQGYLDYTNNRANQTKRDAL